VFQDFVQGLSILSRGSLDEKLRWAFSLYDINGDGYITREEMTDVVTAIYELMGKFTEPCVDESTVRDKVDRIFQVTILSPRDYLISYSIPVQ
jgi:Ca2+-binding EF-hand superfamily protein